VSDKNELLNLQKPGPRGGSCSEKCIDRTTAVKWSRKGHFTRVILSAVPRDEKIQRAIRIKENIQFYPIDFALEILHLCKNIGWLDIL